MKRTASQKKINRAIALLKAIQSDQEKLSIIRDRMRSKVEDALAIMDCFSDADEMITSALDDLERAIDKMSELV